MVFARYLSYIMDINYRTIIEITLQLFLSIYSRLRITRENHPKYTQRELRIRRDNHG